MFIGGKKTPLSCCAKHHISWSQTHFPHLKSPFSDYPLHQKTDSVSYTLYFDPSHPNHQHATSINVFKDPKRGRTSRPRDQLMQIWCNDCLPLSRYPRDKARQTIGVTTNTDTKQALCGMALSS